MSTKKIGALIGEIDADTSDTEKVKEKILAAVFVKFGAFLSCSVAKTAGVSRLSLYSKTCKGSICLVWCQKQ